MALKFRRGTQAELDALVGSSATGEPIYTTDTGKLYVGDGSSSTGTLINPDVGLNDLTDVVTAGVANGQVLTWNTTGNTWEPQTLNIAQELNDLTNVDAVSGVATNKILKYDSSANGGAGGWVVGDEAFLSFDLDAQLASKSIDGLGDVSTSGADTPINGQILTWDNLAAQWKPGDLDLNALQITQLNADLQGSVFAEDSSTIIDGTDGTVKLFNGVMNIVDNKITVQGVNEVRIGDINDVVSNVFQVINADGSEPIEIVNIAGTGINDSAKFTFTGRHGDMVTPVKATAGDYVGVLSSRSVDPDVDGSGTEGNVPNSIIALTVDNNETVANDTAKGKIIFLNNAGTGTAPSLVAASFDARGYFAINQAAVHVADAHLDVNGFMKLAPQTSAPTAVEGMIVIADGTNWDPASKGGAVSYPVYYDGVAWNALY
jgi:hypothetical protein